MDDIHIYPSSNPSCLTYNANYTIEAKHTDYSTFNVNVGMETNLKTWKKRIRKY